MSTKTKQCDYCGAKDGRHVKGCVHAVPETPMDGVSANGETKMPTINGTTGKLVEVDGEPAVVVEQPALIEPPRRSLRDELKSLENAMGEYDEAKSAHRETTETLTEAKKRVDICARAVIEANMRELQMRLGESATE